MKLQLMILLAAVTFVGTTRGQEADSKPSDPGVAKPAIDLEPARGAPVADPVLAEPDQRVELHRSSPTSSQLASSPSERRKMMAAKLRQARALYRSQQRIQRLEMYKWLGYEPLRPNWVTIPSMTSRYQTRTIYVPVYIYGR